jgi:hypothetical protein
MLSFIAQLLEFSCINKNLCSLLLCYYKLDASITSNVLYTVTEFHIMIYSQIKLGNYTLFSFIITKRDWFELCRLLDSDCTAC